MENEHELSYETLTRVYLGSYEHYKGVLSEVEHSKPGFELQCSKMVEMGRFRIIWEQIIAAYKGYRGGDSGNWSIRCIGTRYGVSGLLGVGSKNKIFHNFLGLVWIRRIGPPRYSISDLFGMVYLLFGLGVLGSLGMAYWLFRYGVLGFLGTAYWLFGYGELAENVLLMIFDQSIIYGVSADVDTAYSSK
ncbi:hypothetical protein Tco_0424075 [Tanacetum coccineum]